MTLIYLVRHGETDWNRAHRIQGSTDISLNDTGREQAARSGQLLARRDWDAIYSSPLSRAHETAVIIARAVGLGSPAIVDDLAERNYGSAEGLTRHEIDRIYPPGSDVPGRETREAVADRATAALLALADEHHDGSIIVVSHGGVIRSVLATVDPQSSGEPIRNGSIHSFRHSDGAFELMMFDDRVAIESRDVAVEELEDQNEIEARESARIAR